jgi:hypothetical protein
MPGWLRLEPSGLNVESVQDLLHEGIVFSRGLSLTLGSL